MTIRELERESQERLQKAYEALKLSDPDGYTGTAEREYQKELARNLQKDGNKAANASTDQRIAGKLKAVGYSLDEIEKVIEQHSPMAVKPSQEQRQAYAKNVAQKASFSRSNERNKQVGERCLDQLETGVTKKIYGMPSEERFFIRPELAPQEIQSAVAKLMQTSVDSILIYNSDEQEIPVLNDNISYLVDCSSVMGDFPIYITIYPRLPDVDERLPNDPDRLAFISQFCALLSCETLVESDDSPDLEKGWMILNGEGIRKEVVLDGEKIIDDGSFIIRSMVGEIS